MIVITTGRVVHDRLEQLAALAKLAFRADAAGDVLKDAEDADDFVAFVDDRRLGDFHEAPPGTDVVRFDQRHGGARPDDALVVGAVLDREFVRDEVEIGLADEVRRAWC